MFKKDFHYSQPLEMAILGGCLIEKDAFGRTFGLIDKDSFYFDDHKEVYSVMKEMYENGFPIDILTVADYIIRKKGISEFSGYNVAYFVTNLTNSVVSSAHIEYHSHIIKTMWMEREIIILTNSGASMTGDVRKKIYELQNRLQEISNYGSEDDWEDITTLMVKLYQHQEEMKISKGMGLTTGSYKLDKSNGGFHPGQMIILAARPSVGKSAFAGQMAIEIAKKGGKVGIISLEMNNTEIAARIASIDANVDFDVTYRALYKDQIQKEMVYNRIANHTSSLPIWVTDKTKVNIHDIRAKAEKLKHKEGLDILMIDYLQLVEGDESMRNRNREQEVSKISRGCKIMAKEMGIPVIVLCQLNRDVTKRKGEHRYPELSDLRESGSLEQDADVVTFIHRDWMAGVQVKDDGGSTEREADLVIRKWRNGASNFIIQLDFDPPKMKFSERRDVPGYIPVKVADDLSDGDKPF
jgi:replicative DNA helicase